MRDAQLYLERKMKPFGTLSGFPPLVFKQRYLGSQRGKGIPNPSALPQETTRER